MGHGRAGVAADIGHARLEESLGDGENALPPKDLPLTELELLDFFGERPFHRALFYHNPSRRTAMPHSTTRDGVRVYYEEHGRGEPVLLAYGIGGNAGMWEPNMGAFSARHRLILSEPPRHARSDSPAGPRKGTFAH